MKIGELSTRSLTPVETIRYYEREGLLPAAPRSEANYRVYGVEHVERLGFVRNCRLLDMSLDEIRVLLRCKDEPDADCGDVDALVERHIGHVSARIRVLRQLEKQLRLLRERCAGSRDAAHCGILDGLSAPTRGVALSATTLEPNAQLQPGPRPQPRPNAHPPGAHPRPGGAAPRG